VRSGAVGESESGAQVALQVLDLLDVFQQLGIYCLLDCLQLVSPLGLGLLALLYLFDSDLGGILEFVLGVSLGLLEESIVDVGSDSVNANLGGGGDDVGGVDSLEWHSVDGVGASHEEVA